MSRSMSLKELDVYLNSAQQKIVAVAGELNEVQTQFVSAYQASKAQHDATLTGLCKQAAQDQGSLPLDVQQAIARRLPVERQMLEERRKDLQEKVLPQAEQMADALLKQAQEATAQMRSVNPRLNQNEEQYKANWGRAQADLDALNAEIQKRSGCLGSIVNYGKLNELDRKRHLVLGKMEEYNKLLKGVREEWERLYQEYNLKEQDLQARWQQANLDLARLREELAHLSDDDRREKLALERAIYNVFDNWKTPGLPSDGQAGSGESDGLPAQLNRMVHYNIETDAYQEGLGKIAGMIALLGGIRQGLESVGQSVTALINEQQMHAAYLSDVGVKVDDGVLQFHQQWDGLRAKVQDEKALGKAPTQFSALFDAEVKSDLSEARVKAMFSSLGASLKAATAGWKG